MRLSLLFEEEEDAAWIKKMGPGLKSSPV